jgi:MOSC domain-containing protein YiiM
MWWRPAILVRTVMAVDEPATAGSQEDQNMWAGSVVAIYIAEAEGAATFPVDEIKAVPGAGIEGDRTFRPGGDQAPEDEITLIAQEAIDALAREAGIELAPGEHRRNVVTAGVPLNDLVGEEFQVGPVRLRGIELREPCKYLENLTGRPGLIRGLVHRGGLGAQILTGGTVRVGDPVSR